MHSDTILLVVHKRETDPGHVGRHLRGLGYRLETRCPRFGDPLPATLANHAGAVIFGGPMSVNDPDDYISEEIDWIGVALREEKPLLGICLGGQMIAKHLGAEVKRHEDCEAEVGYHQIAPCCAAEAGDWPSWVYQWHSEGFGLPHGAKALASGAIFENQAFRFGRSAVALQFHPEMTLAMINRWTARSLHKYSGPTVHRRDRQILDHMRFGPVKQRWLGSFLRSWIGSHERRAGAAAP